MKLKYFTAGLIIGAVAATTVTVAAANMQVTAWLVDGSMTLCIDGVPQELPDEYHIVNYGDRIYLPFRMIGEAVGGEVSYDSERRRVNIDMPPPVVEKIIKEVKVEPEPAVVEPEVAYSELPMKLKINEVTITVYGITYSTSKSGITTVDVELENETMNPVNLLYKDAYIEVDGVKYESQYQLNSSSWMNSIAPYEKAEEQRLVFGSLPEKRKNITLVIPVDIWETNKSATKNFRFNIDISDQ